MVKTLNKLIFTELRGRTVSVLASGNRVLQIGTAPEREDCALGTICVGRVRNIVKNINAAFVEYRPGQKTGSICLQTGGTDPVR